MKTFLFIGCIFSGIGMLLTMTALIDYGEIRGIDGFKRAWRSFRKSQSGKIWMVFYVFFVLFYSLLILEKYRFIKF